MSCEATSKDLSGLLDKTSWFLKFDFGVTVYSRPLRVQLGSKSRFGRCGSFVLRGGFHSPAGAGGTSSASCLGSDAIFVTTSMAAGMFHASSHKKSACIVEKRLKSVPDTRFRFSEALPLDMDAIVDDSREN